MYVIIFLFNECFGLGGLYTMLRFRRFLSVLLSFTLAFSLMGVPAHADESRQSDSATRFAEEDDQQLSETESEPKDDIGSIDFTDIAGDQSDVSEGKIVPQDMVNQNETNTVREDKDTISFLYIANDEISIGGQQEFAFALSDESVNMGSAELCMRSIVTGEEFTISNEAVYGGAASFVMDLKSLPVGTIKVESISYVLQGDSLVRIVDLSDKEYSFDILENNEIQDSVMAYYQDENGAIVETDDLDAALSEVVGMEGEMQTSPFSFRSRAAGDAVASPVIALDPGHGGSDPGATGNGLEEADLTWKIAVACKSQLESYGFRVVLARGENDNVGASDYLDRVERVLHYGAEVYVS
ncbi:MAG: N-acetylmuramoyl-L-alanine amidase, partial [Hungatella sp.]